MTYSFTQCSALKSNGHRCRRVAYEGSTFCFSHRNHKPNIDYSKLDPYKDLHLDLSGTPISSLCNGCGEAIADGPNGLCSRCSEFQDRVEGAVRYAASVLGRADLERICTYLERFGVDKGITESTLRRMLAEGKVKAHYD